MPLGLRCALRAVAVLALLPAGASVAAQNPAPDSGDNPAPIRDPPVENPRLASGIDRVAGTEAASNIDYVRLILRGLPSRSGEPMQAAPERPPLLIAQCTRRPNGLHLFEVFASFGEARDFGFYPPWVPANSNDLFPPRTVKVTMTMEFLGYTHVKPLHREWEIPVHTPGLYRYNAPGMGSANLDQIAFDLRYLLALPTLRLSLGPQVAQFATTPWLNAIRTEPLCRAAAL